VSELIAGKASNPPSKYSMLLFEGFEPLDAFGPIEVLAALGRSYHIELSLIAENLDLISSTPPIPNNLNSSVWPKVKPTHTFKTAPQDSTSRL
jgi:putative intracellular protease/amidase